MVTAPCRRRWGTLAIALGLLSLSAAAVIWYFAPPAYEATALLKVDSRRPAVLATDHVDHVEFPIFKRTQVQLLASTVVANNVLRDPEILALRTVQAHQDDPAAWLKEQLEVDFPDDAEVMRIRMQGPRGADLVKIVDRVVDVYLKEIVQRENQLRYKIEAELQVAYERQIAEYQKQLDALKALETIHQTSGSEAAQIKKQVARQELDAWLDQRRKMLDRIEEAELELRIQRAFDHPGGARTAAAETDQPDAPAADQADAPANDAPAAADEKTEPAGVEAVPEAPAALSPLDLLQVKLEFFAEKRAEADRMILEAEEKLAGLESFSATVAAKQEELAALERLNNELRGKLNRLRIERLAPERITQVESAVSARDSRRNASLIAAGSLSVLGLALVIGGGLTRRRGPPAEIRETATT